MWHTFTHDSTLLENFWKWKKISFFPYGNKVRSMKSWLLKKLDSSIKAFVFESSAIAPLCQICPKIYKWSDSCCVLCTKLSMCISSFKFTKNKQMLHYWLFTKLPNRVMHMFAKKIFVNSQCSYFFFEYLNYFSRSITPKFLQSYSTILLQIKKQLKSPAFRMSYYLCPISCKLTCKKNLSLIYY